MPPSKMHVGLSLSVLRFLRVHANVGVEPVRSDRVVGAPF